MGLRAALLLFSLFFIVLACSRGAFTLSGFTNTLVASISGLEGTGLILELDGTTEVQVTTDGTQLISNYAASGSAYTLTIKNQPLCKPQTCQITAGGSGTISGETTATVTCSGDETILAATNWGSDDFWITDDIHNYSDGANASPRIVAGAATTVTNPVTRMNLTIDRVRKRAYMADQNTIRAFDNIDTITGNVAPAALITITGGVSLLNVTIDARRDRLYATGNDGTNDVIWILNDASTLSGAAAPDEAINDVGAMFLFLDEVNDRLYSGRITGVIKVFDAASTLISSDTADRTITLNENAAVTAPNVGSLWVDGCNDKLVVSERDGSDAGNHIFIFDSASTLNGVVGADSGSSARRANIGGGLMNVAVDTYHDRMLAWLDSATSVFIWENFSQLSGAMAVHDKTILNVLSLGYGLGLYHY